MSASYEVRGHVAVITLNNPPVNGLGYDTRRGIADGIDKARADAAVKAIVITGAGKAFSGGADIREFGSPKAIAEPNLLSLWLQFEASAKPIVAAMHTVVMGGGLTEAVGESWVKKVRKAVQTSAFPNRCKGVEVLASELEDDAGLLGAALLAREALA